MNPATTTARQVYDAQPAAYANAPVATHTTTTTARPTELEQNVNVVTPRDRVRWGPIVAGLLAALATFVLLTILGSAIGATTLSVNGNAPPPGAGGREYGIAAGIWGAISALLSFFIGGYIAAKASAVGGSGNGWLNGSMVFLSGLFLIIWLASQGAGGLFGALGTNLGDLINLGQNTAAQNPGAAQQAGQAAQNAAAQAQAAANDPNVRNAAVDGARNGLWWSFVSILAGLLAAGLGGVVGHRSEREVWRENAGTGR